MLNCFFSVSVGSSYSCPALSPLNLKCLLRLSDFELIIGKGKTEGQGATLYRPDTSILTTHQRVILTAIAIVELLACRAISCYD